MSDFYSGGWSVFVAVASVVSMIACLVLQAAAAVLVLIRPGRRPIDA